jgi:predicted NAD/FAD-dependent oxidoreductase
MVEADRIAVIRSGMAGLFCARRLADAGYAPIVLEKGRGIVGRLATRP